MSRARGTGRGRGSGRGRGRSQTTGLLRSTPEGPNLGELLPPQPASSLNTYPSMNDHIPPPPSRQNSSSRLAAQPSSTMGFHDTQQQQQQSERLPKRTRTRQDSDMSQETLVNDVSDMKASFGPRRAQTGVSPDSSIYSDLSHLKRTAPYAMMSDSMLLNEPGPFDSVSQRGGPSEYTSGSRIGRSKTFDDTASTGGYAPKPEDTAKPSFYRAANAADQLRQRMPSVMGSASDFLGRFDPNDRFSSSMSVVSSDREASSDAWVRRQRIKPGRAKTKKVKLTKGRFIAEYGKHLASFTLCFDSRLTLYRAAQMSPRPSAMPTLLVDMVIWPKRPSSRICAIPLRE